MLNAKFQFLKGSIKVLLKNRNLIAFLIFQFLKGSIKVQNRY